MRVRFLIASSFVGLRIRLKFGPIRLKFWPHKAEVASNICCGFTHNVKRMHHNVKQGWVGRQFYWEDQEILNRTITVYELLTKREQFPNAHYLELWFAGYAADCDVVQKTWLSLLLSTEQAWLNGASDADGIEDALAPISVFIGRKLSSDAGLPYEETQALVLEILNSIFSPVVGFDVASCTELIHTANTWLHYASAPHLEPFSITGEILQKALDFVRAYLSIESMHREILGATDAELENAHRRWRILHHVIGLLAPRTCHGEIDTELARIGRRLSVVLGCPCIFALLWLGRNRMGPLVDSRLNEAGQEIQNHILKSK